MKNLNLFFIFFFLAQPVFAQMGAQTQAKVTIRNQHITEPIEVSFHKTTHLIFNSVVRYADRGSEDFIADNPFAVNNIIRLKASKKYFVPSNLTVATADGKLYHFLVNYADEPKKLRISFLDEKQQLQTSKPTSIPETSEAELQDLAYQASTTPINLNKKNTWLGLELRITGIYTQGDFVFVKFTLTNRSRIIYKIKQISYHLLDKKTSKRSSSQEFELFPLLTYTSPNPLNEPDGKTRVWRDQTMEKVLIFPKFTISDKKLFHLEIVGEDRNISVAFKSKAILKATNLGGGVH